MNKRRSAFLLLFYLALAASAQEPFRPVRYQLPEGTYLSVALHADGYFGSDALTNGLAEDYLSHKFITDERKRQLDQREQVDFHQGFVIDSLTVLQKLTGTALQEGDAAIRKGVRFYKEKQFTAEGRSLWRYPEHYPTDIHHQAQGIITFSEHDPDFAATVLKWTLEKLYDAKRGCFGYRKYRLFTDMTSHVRWANAWMAVALERAGERH